MKCHVCGGRLESTISDLPFRLGPTRIVVIKQLPVLECTHCTEFSIADPIMEKVDDLLGQMDETAGLDLADSMVSEITSDPLITIAKGISYERKDVMTIESYKACSIRVLLLDGEPDGIRIAEKTMSTTQAMAFRRSQLESAKSKFGEMIERPGVYILLGEDDVQDQGEAYIGESEGIYTRLKDHSNKENKNLFWEDTIVLVSKDENLTKSHARYVESRLIKDAQGNPRWSLPNRQEPSDTAGRLPLADRIDMDKFVDEAKMLVGVLGCGIFRSVRSTKSENSADTTQRVNEEPTMHETFELRSKDYRARMKLSDTGHFIIQAGSKARADTVDSVPENVKKLRDSMIKQGDLRPTEDSLEFSTDYRFSSVSAAAGVVSGSSINGRTAWKLPDGRSYGDWESSQGDNESSQ